MSWEQVYTVSDSTAHPAGEISLSEAGFKERAHLQEWVIGNPAILGEDVVVVTSEMGQWVNSAGIKEQDRLDILGLDATGQLVVAELKRGIAPDTVEMQAIKYAAMASQFTVSVLAAHHAKYLTTREGHEVDSEEALGRLLGHARDMSDETLSAPRIVLLAADFPPVITNSAVFLRGVGLDITLVKFQAYKTLGGEYLVTVSQLYPLPEIDTVGPKGIQQQKVEQERTREARTVTRLVTAGAIPDGQEFVLRSPNQKDNEVIDDLMKWVAENPDRGRATWKSHASKPLVWAIDAKGYSPSGLVSHLFEEAVGEDIRGIPGPIWWVDAAGHTMRQLADAIS